MNVKIDFLPEFMRLAKPLWKKYASFEKDYLLLLDELRSNPFVGTQLGDGVRKVRMTISSKGKGKSGGARVLTYSVNKESDDEIKVTLLSIYDKSKISNVSDDYISSLIKEMKKNLQRLQKSLVENPPLTAQIKYVNY